MIDAALYSKYTNSSYLVTKSVHELYDAVPTASPISSSAISTPPTVSYRCQVIVTSVTGHTDCSGTLLIGSDSLDFSASGQKKVCTTNIAANTKPAISYTGLDCQITIECVDSGGAPIYSETETAINVAWNDTQKWVPAPEGGWTAITNTTASTEDSTIDVGDVLRKTSGGADYQVKATHDIHNHLGLFVKRKLIF
jgi:hypothetical protein